MANFHQPEGASRSRPRVSSLPEISEDQLVSMEASTHVHCPTNPVALGAGGYCHCKRQDGETSFNRMPRRDQ